jgi:small subunit ribosomal protein S5
VSGHSKWSQIKHKKALTVKKRGQLFSRISKLITIAARKGADPKSNAILAQAIEKATSRAKKNMISIAIVEGTIPHQVEAKMGSAVILLKPQRKGRGLVAGGAVRTICDLAGIKNVSSKILSGSKNKLNNARATMEALRKLKIR